MNPWTAPRTWSVGEMATKAILDTHVRDNELWLQAVAEQAGRVGCYVAEDCFFVPGTGVAPHLAGGVTAALTTGTVTALVGTATVAGHPGILALNTGTSSTGAAGLIGPADVTWLGTHEVYFEAIVSLSALSDGTNRFTTRLGLGDSATAESTDFVGFRYVDNVNSGEWLGVCRSNSSESTLDTNVLASQGWVRLGFVVNAAGTSVTFYSGGIAVGSITTNIPTTATRALTFMPGSIVKSIGTTSRSMYVDAYNYLLPIGR